jgi:hypothetical protein
MDKLVCQIFSDHEIQHLGRIFPIHVPNSDPPIKHTLHLRTLEDPIYSSKTSQIKALKFILVHIGILNPLY